MKENETVKLKDSAVEDSDSIIFECEDLKDGDWVDIRHLDAREKSKMKEEVKVNIHVRIVDVWPFKD